MIKFKFWQAGEDYFKIRKRLWTKFLVPFFSGILCFFAMTELKINDEIKIENIFKDFINVQISAIAILISFSIAIMTILVTADNRNIAEIKITPSTECKPLNGQTLNLFQVLLSNITYNILIEVIYLVLLITFVFVQLFVSEFVLKILMGVCIFFIIHLLHILLESVGQMYLTFWKKHTQ